MVMRIKHVAATPEDYRAQCVRLHELLIAFDPLFGNLILDEIRQQECVLVKYLLYMEELTLKRPADIIQKMASEQCKGELRRLGVIYITVEDATLFTGDLPSDPRIWDPVDVTQWVAKTLLPRDQTATIPDLQMTGTEICARPEIWFTDKFPGEMGTVLYTDLQQRKDDVARHGGLREVGSVFLPIVVQGGSVEAVQSMLAAGADVNMTAENGVTPIYIAALNGHVDLVQLLIRAGAEVNKATQYEATPLYAAAYIGHVEVVQHLLKAGADVDKAAKDGFTPLYEAAGNGHVEVVQQLLKAGAQVDKAAQDGATPLKIAAQNGHVKVVQQLLKAGAEMDNTHQTGATPLYQAAKKGCAEVVKLLLKTGAEVNKAAQDEATPLYVAAEKGQVEVVNLLLEAGADVDKTHQTGATPLYIAADMGRTDVVQLLLTSGAGVNKARETGATPLFVAAMKGHIEVVQQLLKAGAEVDMATQGGVSPLIITANNGHVEVVQQLLKAGAEVDKADQQNGVTALFMAANNGHVEVVQQLLKAGAEVDKATQEGACPLHAAAQEGHVEVVQQLLKAGAEVEKTNQKGAAPLIIAAENGHAEIVQLLLKSGADVNKATQDVDGVGTTPLHQASQNGHMKVVEKLLKAGAEVNKTREDGSGVSPLTVAASNGHVEVVQQLLKAGADVYTTQKDEVTPLYIAAQNGHVEVVQHLLKAGVEAEKIMQVNIREVGYYQDVTALHVATINGHFEVALVLILFSKGIINQKATMDVARLTEEYQEVTPLHIASAAGHLNLVSALISAGADITCTGIIKSKESGLANELNSYDVAVAKGHNLIAYILWSANNGKAASQQTFPEALATHWATIEARQQTEKHIIRKLITTFLVEHVAQRWQKLGQRLGITEGELDDIQRRCNQGGKKEMAVESLLMWLDRQPHWPNIFNVWWALQDMQMADVADLVLKEVMNERQLASVEDEPSDSALVPIEVEMGGPELRALYDRACEEGFTEVYNTRFVLIGKFGNGKSNLCNSLLGEEFDPEWKITDGIAIHPCVMTQEQQWRKLEGQEDHFPHTVAEVMKKLKDKKEEETDPKSPTKPGRPDSDAMATSTTELAAATTTSTRFENKGEERPEPATSPGDSHSQLDFDASDTTVLDVQATTPKQPVSEAQTAQASPKTFLKASDIFRKQRESDDQSNVTGTKEYPLISIWDFGGQEIFYSTQQVFYTHRAIYGMVLDLTKPLDSPVEEMSTVGSTSHCRREKDFIDYHLESMRAHTRPPVPHRETEAARDIEPPVLVIFTKKDQVPQRRHQQKFHRDTRRHLKGKVIDEHVIDRYFSVDNTKRNPEDSEVTELREFILDLARKQSYMGERIPVKWLELKSRLQEMHKQGKRYCTLQEVMEAIGSPPRETTPEENAVNILKFWHLCGDIIFFPGQNLRNFVILEPQWFVDVCKTIITIPEYRDRQVKKDWDKLQETGELRDHLIEHVWRHREEALQYNLIEHKQELLDMMEKFDLVIRCHGRSDEESGPKCDATEEATYFVPSLLTTVTDEKKLYPPGTTCSKPIFIVFDGQFCPVGLYHRLVILTMRRYFNVKPRRAYASCAKFITDNRKQTFVITKEKFFLKIELVSSVKDDANPFNHGPSVRKGLEEDLRAIINTWAPGIKYKWCLMCSCEGHKEKEDVESFLPIEDASATAYFESGEVVCETYAPATVTVQDVGLADWFRNPLPQVGDEELSAHPAGQPSVLQDCFHMVVKDVCPQWRELGFRLNLSSANVDEIDELHRGNPRKCCRAVCDRWVQLNGSSATVDVLKDALISIREVPTAENIDEYLQQMANRQPTQIQLQTGEGRGSAYSCFAVIVEDVCPRWTELSRHLGLTEAQVEEVAEKHSGDPRECCWEALKLWSRINGKYASKERLREALVSAEEIATAEKLDTLTQ